MGSGFLDDISSIRLEILDLSNTSIKSLPASISSLVALREFFLRGCALLMELPPEIGGLKNLKVFDFEGTEVICLPKEIAELSNLECLKGSLCGCADHYKKSKGIAAIIPKMTLSKLTQLKVLSIDVNTDGEWWDAEVKNIMNELSSLSNLESLMLYLPTAQSLEQLLQLTRNRQFLCSALSHFRLIVGCHEQYFVSHIPDNLEEEFEKFEKCLKDINGEGNTDVIGKALEHTTALFLDSHWTIEDLSTFKIDDLHKLKFCLLRECNEMQTIVDGGKYYNECRDYLGEKYALGSLEYLGVYYMEKLQSIWTGPICSGSLYSLGTLALHTCPNLTTIFTLGLLHNLVNLKDLLVEDCPKVSGLVSIDSSCLERNRFLPRLTKMSLLDLPELMNLSSGLNIAAKLETLVVINCEKLKSFSCMEVSSEDIKEIKGESEWWDSLMWHESEWSSGRPDYLVRAFLPLGSHGDLMDQPEEDGNLLQYVVQGAEPLSTDREPGDTKFIPYPRSSGPGSRLATTTASPLHPQLPGTSLYSSTSHSALIASRTSGASETSPCTLSRWKKGILLDRGTYGDVYLGCDSGSGQMCFIEEVRVIADDQTSKIFLNQLNQEITLLSQLSHPNILQYYGSELGEEKLSIFSEYVSSCSIQKALRERGPFGEPVIQYCAREILSGLAFLHAKKMMHGNIEGANIIVDPDGKIKLADLVRAKHFLTCSGLPRDIWSLGLTIIEMATSKRPWFEFEGRQHLSLDAQDFMNLCFQEDPSARPTASQLLDHPFVRHQATTRVASIIRSNQGRISNHLPWEPHREPGDTKFIPYPRSSGPGSRLATTTASPLHQQLPGTSLYSSTSHSALIAPRTSGASETSPCTLSRWKKGILLDRGKYGDVYLGCDSGSGQMCFIEEVRVIADDQTSKIFLNQLNQEITLLSQLSHPNILQYYGSELGEETLSIYSEYVSSGSIQKALREHGPFGEPVIQYCAREILSGLAYLHAKKMMHGNIDGANIIVDPDGKIKLADFGMAKYMLSSIETSLWMAPEVLRRTSYSLPMDIWSLGCTIIEMATSKPPWSQLDGILGFFRIRYSEEIPKIPEHLSPDAQDFMKLCLQRDPSARPTASQLLDHPFVRHQATTRVASIIRSNQGRISNHLPWEPHTGDDLREAKLYEPRGGVVPEENF